MIVGMRLGEVADHLVGVHVGGGAAAGLENVDHELIVVLAGGDFFGGFFDGGREIRRQLAEPAVHVRRRALDQAERADERPRKTQTADGEILDGALRLRAVERVGWERASRPWCRVRCGSPRFDCRP